MSFGGTHGAVAQANAGNIYVSTQSATGVLVYNRSGSFGQDHSKCVSRSFIRWFTPRSTERSFFYTTVQKGTPAENWLFIKMKTDGTVVMKNHRSAGSRV